MKSIQTKLKKNNAMVMKTDKGHSLIILPSEQYESKIHKFVNKNKFQASNTDSTKTSQNQIRKTIKHSKVLIPSNVTWKYTTLNPSAPTRKGLKITHKPYQPICPVLNWRNAPAYKIAKTFTQKINEISPLSYPFNIKNSTQLIQNLKEIPVQPSYAFASLDIQNVYSNIPITDQRHPQQCHER
jgi:hypothetical protein